MKPLQLSIFSRVFFSSFLAVPHPLLNIPIQPLGHLCCCLLLHFGIVHLLLWLLYLPADLWMAGLCSGHSCILGSDLMLDAGYMLQVCFWNKQIRQSLRKQFGHLFFIDEMWGLWNSRCLSLFLFLKTDKPILFFPRIILRTWWCFGKNFLISFSQLALWPQRQTQRKTLNFPELREPKQWNC